MEWKRRTRVSRGVADCLVMLAVVLVFAGCAGANVSANPPPTGHAAQITFPTVTPTATPPSHPLPPAPQLSARAADLVNPDTGQVYLAVNANTEMAMASNRLPPM